MLDPDLEIELQELQIALTLLQSFDPPGVGARSLPECLLLQLRQPDLDVLTMFKDDQVLGIARKVCESYLEMLAAGQLNRICELLGCTLPQLQQAYAGIRRLDPKPGSRWNKPAADYAIPDVIARKKKSGWQIELNEAIMPRLRVNDVYARMLGSSRSSEYAALQGQLQEARWLIRNVSQRFETILRVSQAIASHQKDFFDQGWVALRPLTLRDISAELGLHESTVSRATTQKYMLTPFGTIELKRFFVGGLSTEGGESTSAIAVQTKIREFIQAENPVKPLSDAQLVKMLQSQGITIARRTVAKYREQMRIPTASLRKSQAGLS